MVTLAVVLAASLLQAAPSSESVAALNKQFSELELRVKQAIRDKNSSALDGVLAKDFSYSAHVEGRAPHVLSRSEALDVATNYVTLENFEIQHLVARPFGNVVVVRFEVVRKVTFGKVDRSGTRSIVDTWVKSGKSWLLAYRLVSSPTPPIKQ